MRKFVAILFYCFACAIHFGHSIIPHNHEHQHIAKDHHHGDESNNKSIFDLFAHFGQTGENFTSQTEQQTCVSKKSISSDATIEFSFGENNTIVQKSQPKSFAEPYIFISPHLTSFHFRGPPVII